MKTKSRIKGLLMTTLVALFVLTVSSESNAQEKISSDLKAFKITFEKTDNGIKMHSDKGSAWIDLSFSLPDYKPQAIDEFGMTK